MNRGKGNATHMRTKGQRGYTIVEVLIFLAVSAVLFGATMTLLAGRQQRVQFTNAVRDFETKLLDVANDVSNGYYQSNGNIECSSGPSITVTAAPAKDQGTNLDCVFIGKAIKLGLGSGDDSGLYGVYTLAGNRLPNTTVAPGLSDANPMVVWDGIASADSVRERLKLGYGAAIACIGIGKANCDPFMDTGTGAALVFATRLTGGAQAGSAGGAITADIYYVENIPIDQNEDSFVTAATPDRLQRLSAGEMITICVQSGTTKQYALFNIVNGKISSLIKEGNTCG